MIIYLIFILNFKQLFQLVKEKRFDVATLHDLSKRIHFCKKNNPTPFNFDQYLTPNQNNAPPLTITETNLSSTFLNSSLTHVNLPVIQSLLPLTPLPTQTNVTLPVQFLRSFATGISRSQMGLAPRKIRKTQ
jgi:hypothetical protein